MEEAAGISDVMARRDLARKMATALDCVEYVKRCKVGAARVTTFEKTRTANLSYTCF